MFIPPADGKARRSKWSVGGQFLVNVTNAYVSGAGVQAKVIEYNRPLNQKEFNDDAGPS